MGFGLGRATEASIILVWAFAEGDMMGGGEQMSSRAAWAREAGSMEDKDGEEEEEAKEEDVEVGRSVELTLLKPFLECAPVGCE